MDIKWLEDFLCLCEQMNFSRAAEKRYITQSAFSRRIKSLESWLGTTLITRDAYPPHLTPDGELFRQTALETLHGLNQLRDQYHQRKQQAPQRLRIVTQQTISTTFLPEWIMRVQGVWSDVQIQLQAEKISDCVDALMGGDADVMFIYNHNAIPFSLNAALYPRMVVGKEVLMPVSRPDANQQPLHPLSELAEKPSPYLGYTPVSCFGQALNDWQQRQDKPCYLQLRYENSFSHSLRVLALKGHGLAWLPARGIQHELEAGLLCRAGDPCWDVHFDICLYHAQERLEPLTRELLAFSQRHFAHPLASA